MRVVVFGTYDKAVHPRAAVLIDGLADQGFDVRELNAPLGLGTANRVAMLQHPGRLPALVVRLARCWVRLLAGSFAVGTAEAVLVPYMGHFDVLLARLRWPRRLVVLDYLVSAAGTARDRGESGRVKITLLRGLDRIALSAADVVVVDTDESAAALPQSRRRRAVVVPVGATEHWFAAAERASAPPTSGPLRVVFFGLFTPLQGTPTIARALARIEDGLLAVTLIGTGQDHAEVRRLLSARSDITWHDWVPADRLPHLVAGHDVCLGIFGDTPKALTVVPTKVYQGAAAGCAIVTSRTPAQQHALQDAAVLVPPADDHALAEALVALSRDPAGLARLRESAAVRGLAFAPANAVRPLAEELVVRVGGSAPSTSEPTTRLSS